MIKCWLCVWILVPVCWCCWLADSPDGAVGLGESPLNPWTLLLSECRGFLPLEKTSHQNDFSVSGRRIIRIRLLWLLTGDPSTAFRLLDSLCGIAEFWDSRKLIGKGCMEKKIIMGKKTPKSQFEMQSSWSCPKLNSWAVCDVWALSTEKLKVHLCSFGLGCWAEPLWPRCGQRERLELEETEAISETGLVVSACTAVLQCQRSRRDLWVQKAAEMDSGWAQDANELLAAVPLMSVIPAQSRALLWAE